jgi:hypothetical protein
MSPLSEGLIERGFALLHNKEKFQTKAVDKFISYFIEKVRLYPGCKAVLKGKGICKNG